MSSIIRITPCKNRLLLGTYSLTFILFLSQACKTSSADELHRYQGFHVKKYIPESRVSDGFNNYYNFILPVCKEIGLPPLHDGYDSVQIRLWFIKSGYDKGSLVQLQIADDKWMGTHYRFSLKYPDEHWTVLVADKKIKRVHPKNWKAFIGALYSSKITSLPDGEKVKDNESIAMDGGSVTIEYADKKNYRIYNYVSPGLTLCRSSECEHIENITRLTSEELNIPEIKNEQLLHPSLSYVLHPGKTLGL